MTDWEVSVLEKTRSLSPIGVRDLEMQFIPEDRERSRIALQRLLNISGDVVLDDKLRLVSR